MIAKAWTKAKAVRSPSSTIANVSRVAAFFAASLMLQGCDDALDPQASFLFIMKTTTTTSGGVVVLDPSLHLATGSSDAQVCDNTPAPIPGHSTTCGSRWEWLRSQRGYTTEAAKCKVKDEEPKKCACLTCGQVSCDDTPAPIPGHPSTTCGSRWQWLSSAQGYTTSAAKCKVKDEEQQKCACLACTTTTGAKPPTQGTCDESTWPDKDHGLVCSDCKVLVNHFSSKYRNCDGYCATVGMDCAGAWEEVGDTCRVSYQMTCYQELASSDAICQCRPRTPSQGKVLKVMSYNTEFRNYNARMGGYAAKIKDVGPAIVGLQECQNRDGLARRAGYTALTGTGKQNYIVYDTRKMTKVSDGWMRIPRDDYAERAITWGQFEFEGQRIWFFNTHLPHNHNQARSKTTHAKIARMFLDKRKQLGAEAAPTIILGDMNSHASDHNKVAGGGFCSNLEASGFTKAYTARGHPGHPRIDHILYSTAHWSHRNCRDTGTGGSDHTSITCDLVLK